MKEKLIIKNFGPIKSVELELGRFNLLIGEQATGKSTIAKVLAVCRYFSYIVEPRIVSGLFSSFFEGLNAWGLKDAISRDSFIYYECSDYSVTVDYHNVDVTTFHSNDDRFKDERNIWFAAHVKPKSKRFENLLAELDKIKPKAKNLSELASFELMWTIPTSFYKNEVANIMDNPFYLPTERGLQSIFSLGKTSIQNISDSLFNQFARLDQVARLFKKDTLIEPLDITYKNIDGEGFVRKNTETEFYSLYNSASGYQSTIPVVLVVKYYNEIQRKRKTLLIEEPELNLFPTAQNKLINYLVSQVISNNNSLLLTTHSPYIITAVNNLVYAYKTGQNYKEEVNEILSEKFWLNPDDLSAYRLLNDGTARDIIDKDLKEIAVEELDEAGKQINAIYDRILAVKFRQNEKSG